LDQDVKKNKITFFFAHSFIFLLQKKHKKEMSFVDCETLDICVVLAALYNGSRPKGRGILTMSNELMDAYNAKTYLAQGSHIDYLKTRPIRINFKTYPILDMTFYDQENGKGKGAQIVARLK
jgi:hypothetical protein